MPTAFFFCIPLIEAMAVKCCGVVNVAHACTDDGGGEQVPKIVEGTGALEDG